MGFYVVKIPVIRGFQDKTCVYDIVLQHESHNLDYSITESLDMEELLDILCCEDDGHIFNNYEFTEETINNYSDSQWRASVRIPLNKISVDIISPESQWNYFTSI